MLLKCGVKSVALCVFVALNGAAGIVSQNNVRKVVLTMHLHVRNDPWAKMHSMQFISVEVILFYSIIFNMLAVLKTFAAEKTTAALSRGYGRCALCEGGRKAGERRVWRLPFPATGNATSWRAQGFFRVLNDPPRPPPNPRCVRFWT